MFEEKESTLSVIIDSLTSDFSEFCHEWEPAFHNNVLHRFSEKFKCDNFGGVVH